MNIPCARLAPLALAGLLLVPAAGCRYGTAGSLPPEVQTIGVTVLRNETRFPGLETEATNAIITALGSGGRLAVVYAEGDPDLVLTGRITAYTRRSMRTDTYGDPVGFKVLVEARVSVRRADGSYLFKNRVVNNQAADPDSGAANLTLGESERSGRAAAVADLGRNIALTVTEWGW